VAFKSKDNQKEGKGKNKELNMIRDLIDVLYECQEYVEEMIRVGGYSEYDYSNEDLLKRIETVLQENDNL
jgi:hypothetical protein